MPDPPGKSAGTHETEPGLKTQETTMVILESETGSQGFSQLKEINERLLRTLQYYEKK